MKEKKIEKFNRMTKLGVIRQVYKPNDWLSTMVALCNHKTGIRLCIDPVHLNKDFLPPHHPMKIIEQVYMYRHFALLMQNVASGKYHSVRSQRNYHHYDPLKYSPVLLHSTTLTSTSQSCCPQMPHNIAWVPSAYRLANL